jgi:hypothetical protein
VPKTPRPAAKKKPPRPSGPAKSEVEMVRDAADAMYRAAAECCRQHDRVSRVHGKSEVEEELAAAVKSCDHCDQVLSDLSAAYQETAAQVKPTGHDEGWWHRANALWLASREYLRRHGGCDSSTKNLKDHSRERLNALHTEYELEASALLALRHAADAYKRLRPSAA